MEYGFAIYNRNNVNVTGVLTPIFFLDRFTAESGSKTYTNKPEGKTLQAVCSLFPWNNVFKDRKVPKITINGNTVMWSNLEHIFIHSGGELYVWFKHYETRWQLVDKPGVYASVSDQ